MRTNFSGRSLSRAALLGAALMLPGCAGGLEPAPLANAAPAVGEGAARATTAGVTVTTMAMDSWPGPARITEELTPMKVRIRNDSGQPLLVAYNRFRLAGDDGRVYRALPLFRMDGSVPTSLTIRDPFAVRERRFVADRFEIAPFYAPVYPGADLYDGPFTADPAYYGLYETYYGSKPLPTTEMRRRALPEGVLSPGGYVEGYLFFEEVPSSANRVTFQYSLVNAQTSGMLGEVRIPYAVG